MVFKISTQYRSAAVVPRGAHSPPTAGVRRSRTRTLRRTPRYAPTAPHRAPTSTSGRYFATVSCAGEHPAQGLRRDSSGTVLCDRPTARRVPRNPELRSAVTRRPKPRIGRRDDRGQVSLVTRAARPPAGGRSRRRRIGRSPFEIHRVVFARI
ncbi:hypothetical protein EVAR_102967_1 [Eumeta japonica]|uniref:Uncharacterized protein n=1 Tax=Eumeta variegata TaxID=151549 RepID=A0A4C1URC7_EUMVA|nr:hypothetical protein EVAR_102967_1 [Eumeta japonica]